MKTRFNIWAFVLIAAFLAGCTGINKTGVTRAGSDPVPEQVILPENVLKFEYIQQQELAPSVNQAIVTAWALEDGTQASLPFARIDDSAIIEIDPIAIGRKKNSIMHIGNFQTSPEGDMKIDFTTESRDLYGRIDYRMTSMVYRPEAPGAEQVNTMKKWLLSQYYKSGKHVSEFSKNEWKGFQQEAGLTADGLFGPNTATALARTFPTINVKYYRNKILYPQIPNHMVFIIPRDRFVNGMNRLPKGFKSWVEVKKMGLSRDEFKKMAAKGERFVICVYFFDRVNPVFGITGHFEKTPNSKKGKSGTQDYFAKPGTWPVIVRPFKVEKTPGDLYFNLFLKTGSSTERCIGSHKIL